MLIYKGEMQNKRLLYSKVFLDHYQKSMMKPLSAKIATFSCKYFHIKTASWMFDRL